MRIGYSMPAWHIGEAPRSMGGSRKGIHSSLIIDLFRSSQLIGFVVVQVVDDVLQQFDRKSVKRYLRKDVDGSAKNTLASVMKDVSHHSIDLFKAGAR